MRYKTELSYLGTHYAGWQRQPGDSTVQQVLEEAFSTILRQPIEVVGCGRTDTGVHARHYIAHFDADPIPDCEKSVYQLNSVLPSDIAIHSIEQTNDTFHARFDAIEREYRYYLHFQKDPFLQNTSWYFQQGAELNIDLMQQGGNQLLKYDQFKPFCKTGSDAEHYTCTLVESNWTLQAGHGVYTIKANRFLRGMVRLIVGACLNLGLGKITIEQFNDCLQHQTPVPQAWSVPPQGLFLENVKYP